MEEFMRQRVSPGGQLAHYMGKILSVKLWHQERAYALAHGKEISSQPDFEKKKTEFIEGLQLAITKNLPEYASVTNRHLKQMIRLAKKADLSKVAHVKKLYRHYHAIAKTQNYDEAKFFEGL